MAMKILFLIFFFKIAFFNYFFSRILNGYENIDFKIFLLQN